MALIITDTVTLIILIITCYDICRNRRSKELLGQVKSSTFSHHVIMHVEDVEPVRGSGRGGEGVALHDVEAHALLREVQILDHEAASDLGTAKKTLQQ